LAPKNCHNSKVKSTDPAYAVINSFVPMDTTIILTDETGKSLPCSLEATIPVDGVEYFLLQPIDNSVQIFAWESTEEDEEGLLVDVEDSEIDAIFSVAHAVLAEQNLKLKRTAFTLTVEGELPEFNEDDILTIDTDDEDNFEEFQELAHFFDSDQEYSVFSALDPLMFFAKIGKDGKHELLSQEELEAIQPYIQEHLINIDDEDEE